MVQTIDAVQKIIGDADAESFYGIEWHADRNAYLQVQASAGWEEGMTGVRTYPDHAGHVWIDGDAVAEAAQDKRVEALLEAGYSTELAHSQRFGYDDDAARSILG